MHQDFSVYFCKCPEYTVLLSILHQTGNYGRHISPPKTNSEDKSTPVMRKSSVFPSFVFHNVKITLMRNRSII